ncbi:MAG TPA: class D sortase [Bacilli bacterium]
MNKLNNPQQNKLSLVRMIALGFVILGIVCICWALVHIQAQPASTEYTTDDASTVTLAIKHSTYPYGAGVGTIGARNHAEVVENKDDADHISNNSSTTDDGGEGSHVFSTSKLPKVLSTAGEVLYPTRPSEGDSIGNLIIPALNQKMVIIHGADEEELEKGVGHFAQSVLPGENNNAVLSGHRDTVFRQLGKLKLGDKLVTVTSAGRFTYEIIKGQIVDKDDKTIIVPTDQAVLTVTTCYPFWYVGNAPKRYILTAVLGGRE